MPVRTRLTRHAHKERANERQTQANYFYHLQDISLRDAYRRTAFRLLLSAAREPRWGCGY